MTDILGFEVALPKLNVTGFLSNSWIYILIIGIIGFIIIVTIALLLFFKTYNKKVVVFENVSGQGYQPILKTRGRIIKLGSGGEEVMKTLVGGRFLTAYGRKMGRNSYWFAKGSDGYLYNIVLGDLDTKLRMLDIEPIDRDVRMFHVALDRLSHQTYDKQNFLQKYGIHILLFVFLICLVGGMLLIISQVAKATTALAATADTNRAVLDALNGVLNKANNIQTQTQSGGSGLVPVT